MAKNLSIFAAFCWLSVAPGAFAQSEMASLGTAEAAGVEAAAEKPSAQENFTINLKDTDIRVFLDKVSDITGSSFVVDPQVRGNVTVSSASPMSRDEVYSLMLSVLRVNGFAAIPSNGVIKVIKQADVKQSGSAVNKVKGSPGDAIVTQVVPLSNVPVQEMVKVLRPMVSPSGYIEGSDAAKTLVINDYADNVARLMRIIAQLDSSENAQIDVVPLKEAWAGDVVKMLENLDPLKGQAGADSAKVVADERSNSLILRGSESERRRVMGLIAQLDKAANQNGAVKVIYLQHANVNNVLTVLKSLVLGQQSAGNAIDVNSRAAATPVASAPLGNPANSAALPGGISERGDVAIQADTALNAIVVRANPAAMGEITEIIRQLDIQPAQVLIEAAIVEVSTDTLNKLGVQYGAGKAAFDAGFGAANFNSTDVTLASILSRVGTTGSVSLGSGLTVGLGDKDSFSVLIQALSSTANANLLSTPSITTLDNQEAKIVVGQNVPFRTGTYTNDSGSANPFTTIERKDVGITLRVVPQIHQGSLVRMQVQQEVSSLVPGTAGQSNAADIITNKRTIDTTVLAHDGETIVLGGLIQDDKGDSVDRVPVLGDIPVLGKLFSSTQKNRTKRNLLVFLRPSVLQDTAQVSDVAQKKFVRARELQSEQQKSIFFPNRGKENSTVGSLFDHALAGPNEGYWLLD